MKDQETSRLSRLTATLTWLQSRQLVTATELAKRFEVSVRTVYRDIRALEEAGIPIITEEGKGYSLMPGYKLPPVMFSEREANALVTAEKLILATKDTSLIHEFSQAMLKIKSILPSVNQEKTELLASKMVISTYGRQPVNSQYLTVIQQALTNYQVVKIEYKSNQEVVTIRKIEPFALYLNGKEDWTLAAFCQLRQDFRSFRLDRIENLWMDGAYFEPHEMTLEAYVKRYIS